MDSFVNIMYAIISRVLNGFQDIIDSSAYVTTSNLENFGYARYNDSPPTWFDIIINLFLIRFALSDS